MVALHMNGEEMIDSFVKNNWCFREYCSIFTSRNYSFKHLEGR